MRIAIVDVLGSPYDGSTPSKRGLGGSESAVVFIARELTKIGIEVDVYNDCQGLDAEPGVYDGVRYRPASPLDVYSDYYDTVIVSRSVKPFAESSFVSMAKHKILWMHDTFCQGDEFLENYVVNGAIDEIWTLSDWHTTYISQAFHGHRRMMEVLKRKIWVTRNGVNVYQDVDFQKKDYNQFVFNASASKGMTTLLEDIWPRVKHHIPNGKLTIIGGAYPLKEADDQNEALRLLRLNHEGERDVYFTGIIDQKEIARILSNAAFMIYPQSFPETFGISTVESLAYGTPVISGRFGAMEETAIEDGSYLMDYPVDSNALYTFNKSAHVEAFVKLVIEAHKNAYLWQQKSNAAMKVREVCGWDKAALQWKQHLFKITGSYLPVNEYHEVQRINHRTHELFNKRWSNPEEWAYYPEKEKMIHVIVPFYNASQYLSKCIESIRSQNYENYQVHLINDASVDDSGDVVSALIYQDDDPLRWIERLGEERFNYHSNDENQGALANQVMCINEILDPGYEDIIVLIDGDDALINDPNVFKKINRLYHEGAEMTYGSMWSMADNIPLVAQEYPHEVTETKSYRTHRFPWKIPYTHLRTFTVEAFSRIDDSALRDSDGVYYKAAGDSALFYALMDVCDPSRVRAVRDILYLYNDLNPINDYKVNAEEQDKNSEAVAPRQAFRVEDMPEELIEAIRDADYSHIEKTILIAIPTTNGIHPETFKAIYDLKIPKGYRADFQFFYGYCIDQVRNLIANYTLNNYYDYLFCVDYDISFSSDTLEKMLRHNVPIVSGLYIQRKPGEHILEVYRKSENTGAHYNIHMHDLRKNHLESIDACGFGCVLIKNEVLAAIDYPHFTYHHAIRIEDTMSEDVDFCIKAKNKGFNIWADTSILCRHHGATMFEVNL